MAAVDYCVGAMIAAELEYAGDEAIHRTYVPRRIMLDHIPIEDLRAYLAEREQADA